MGILLAFSRVVYYCPGRTLVDSAGSLCKKRTTKAKSLETLRQMPSTWPRGEALGRRTPWQTFRLNGVTTPLHKARSAGTASIAAVLCFIFLLASIPNQSLGVSVRPLLCVLLLPIARAAVVQDIWGTHRSEVLFASSGGGTHVYLSGTDLGSPFAPPTVVLGLRGQVECRAAC